MYQWQGQSYYFEGCKMGKRVRLAKKKIVKRVSVHCLAQC